MENTNKKVNKMEVVKGAAIGFAMGMMWELMIITPIMSDWSFRSIMVAMTVSGCGSSLAGGIIAAVKQKQAKKVEAENSVVF